MKKVKVSPIHLVLGFVTFGNFVLLIKKDHPADQVGKMNGIGGHVEEGESPLEAMRREATEEAGDFVGGLEWVKKGTVIWGRETVLHCFYADGGETPRFENKTSEKLSITPIRRLYGVDCVDDLDYLIPLCMASGLESFALEGHHG